MSCWWVSSTACSSSPSRAFYWLHLSLSLLCSSPSLYPMMDPLNLLVFRSCLFLMVLMMGCGNGHCHGSGFVVLLAECEYLMDLIVQYHVMAVNGWNRGGFVRGFIIGGWVAALLNRSCVYNLMVMVPIMFVSLLL
eukprot:850578_1